jgi:hypothetical protein
MFAPRLLTHDGKTQSISAWAREVGIAQPTLSDRLRRGWPIERVLVPYVRPVPITTLDQLFQQTRLEPNGCRVWQGSTNNKGYGSVYVGKRKPEGAHCLAYRLDHGLVDEIPDGLCVCHHCDNPPCIEPEHLFLGTYSDNARDKIRKGRNRPVHVKGDDNPNAKLTANQARQIRLDDRKCSVIAGEYGIDTSQVFRIKNGTNWKCLGDEHRPKARHRKLTAEQARQIKADSRPRSAIAAEYGVHPITIWEIRTGRKWKHLEPTHDQPAPLAMAA